MVGPQADEARQAPVGPNTAEESKVSDVPSKSAADAEEADKQSDKAREQSALGVQG